MTADLVIASNDAIEHHDRRCERANTPAYRLTCRCAERRAARALTLECGNAAAMSDESVAMAAVKPALMVEELMRRSMAALLRTVADAGRVPILSTLHLISEHDRWLEGTTFRFAVLTVPEGTPASESLLEVADDWMRARGLRG